MVISSIRRNFFFSLLLTFGVAAAERLPRLDEELLALQVLLAQRAVEALAVVVVVEGLDPPVARLDGKAARDALGREQLVPILFAVGEPVLEVEGRVGEDLATVSAHEALRVERPTHRLQAVLSTRLLVLPIVGRPISVTQPIQFIFPLGEKLVHLVVGIKYLFLKS